jgi:hypothetical protein
MYQFKLTGIFAFFMLLLISCKKQKEEAVSLPSPEASLIRNLVFINQNNLEKNVSYGASKIKPMAAIEEGQLVLHFTTASDVPVTADESVSLYINASHLNSNLAKGYTFGTAEPALKRVYYTYSFTESTTSTWGSITDSKSGVVFEGLLNITSYDIKNKLISGSFNVKARRLINDPTVKSIATPVDPANQCDLTLTGTFSYVRLQ